MAAPQLVGEPPLTYLTRLRMQKAATLLRDGAGLGETTRLTGYASNASFSHAFRQLPERDLHPLPIEAMRDLLGIARAAYAVHLRKGNRGIAARLKRAGEDLRRALALATRGPSPAAHERAWQLANSASEVIVRETCLGRELSAMLSK